MNNKRPYEEDSNVSTPSKKPTIRRAQTANKRPSEVVDDGNKSASKKTRQSATYESQTFSSEEPRSAKKAIVRRNTERLSSLLEAKMISPTSVKSSSFGFDDAQPAKMVMDPNDSTPKRRKPTQSKILETATAVPAFTENVPFQHSPPSPLIFENRSFNRDYNSASLKVPSTKEQRENNMSGELAGFWSQCRESLSFCCGAMYPPFLAIIVVAYLLHFFTHNRIFASFAVVFTILSGIVLGFFFVSVVPFVVLTRTIERYLEERNRSDSVFVNLLVRLAILFVTFATVYVVRLVV